MLIRIRDFRNTIHVLMLVTSSHGNSRDKLVWCLQRRFI